MRTLLLYTLLFFCLNANSQTLKDEALSKIENLETLIEQAELKNIDASKEKLAIRTAKTFLEFADWDEANKDLNEEFFAKLSIYKDTAAKAAIFLPDFERREVNILLDESITNIQEYIEGRLFRKPTPNIDWSQVTNDGEHITYDGRPVFLADYTWKPGTDELNEFYGNLDGYFLPLSAVTNASGAIKASVLNDLDSKPSGTAGFIFLNHKSPPSWTKSAYGDGFKMRENSYTNYDIDNPGAKEMWQMILAGVGAKMSGKKYTELGYMLCNEPHFYTTKTNDKVDWASGPVSEYTIEKFRTWLSQKHASIEDLNTLWQTSFADFSAVTIDIPIDRSLIGTPKWYDWNIFNNYRVTEWYKFLKAEIQKNDPYAKVHLKIMPNLWTGNSRGHGIDMEALTEISEIIGNDSGAENAPMWGTHEWQQHYSFDWRELYMGFDFYKSISPNKVMFNSESHYLSTTRSRDLFQKPDYVRAVFWAAATLGLNANQIWLWGRHADGSINTKAGKGYTATNCQQPRVTNEVHSTTMDLNSFAEEIVAMQKQRKPLRIFYSETSAVNKTAHMNDLFELYEKLNFEGVSLGFATQNVIEKQDHQQWDAILIYKTQYITEGERTALQSYLDKGGVIITDNVSLSYNEYGKASGGLSSGTGRIITASSPEDVASKAWDILDEKSSMPDLTISETNGTNKKGCNWKCIKNTQGNIVLSVVNLGKTNAKLNITLKDAAAGTVCYDLIKGVKVSSKPTLKPNEVFFVEVKDEENVSIFKTRKEVKMAKLFPNPSNDIFQIKLFDALRDIKLVVCNMQGQTILVQNFEGSEHISFNLKDYPKGNFLVNISSENVSQTFICVKN